MTLPGGNNSPTPAAFSVEPGHLLEGRVALAFGIACQNLVVSLARTHGIDSPDPEWIIEASDQLRSRVEEHLAWECIESPAVWKANEAKAAEGCSR